MATRFYFEPTTTPSVSPAFDAGWEQTGQALRRLLRYKNNLSALSALADSGTFTIPITTTQDVLAYQFVSEPLLAQRITGNASAVIRVLESAATANVTLAIVIKVVSNDGGTVRGTLLSNFNSDTEFAITAATRILASSAMTALRIQTGDRLVVEIGGHAAAPTAAGSYTVRLGFNAASDFALTSALTTDLNPWVELSENVYTAMQNNFQNIKLPDGLGGGDMIRL